MEAVLFNAHLPEHRGYYNIAKKWWENRDWPIPMTENLSSTGMMVYQDNRPICAAWLYQTDSLMAVIGFLIADIKIKGRVKKRAIKFLLEELEEKARKMGFNIIFMPMESNSVARLAKNEMNYIGNSSNELVKSII